MRKLIFICCLALAFYAAGAQNSKNSIPIIPEPVSVIKKQGYFSLPQKVLIKAPAGLGYTVDLLKNKLGKVAGSVVTLTAANTSHINLALNKKYDATLGDEGYTLSVLSHRITISANKPAGIFYGVQSLLQLLPPEIENKTFVKNIKWQIPIVEITDYPRMGWRGLMLDVSRHFFTVGEIKQYIDAMMRYKYNLLHLHLTDDEGWRLQIKSLPKLTEVGAWRVEKIGNFGFFSDPLPDEPKTYGGFYTQEEIKDIVRYAKERFINIMPEIDVPGHSLAAIASYPELSCTEGADKYSVRAGEPLMDWSGRPPVAFKDNTLCPANEKVYEFMDKVMTEVAELFPFEYIHVGGDEAPHNFWEKSEQVKELMKREGLKNMPQVQSYFGKRLEKIIQSKGKKMMGWDEILEGGITQTTALMSWRGMKYGIEASNSGHYVVMSPEDYAYIDFMQGDPSTEVLVRETLRLNKAYQFNPTPPEANAKYVLGGQANLWTEQIYNMRQAEYMTWPRGFAMAEAVWSPEKNKDWKKFVAKTEDHFKRLRYAQIKYSRAIYDPIVSVSKKDDKYYVTLTPEIEGLKIYTSFDGSEPDNFYPAYTAGPQLMPKDAQFFRAISYRDGKPIGRLMTISAEELKKRAK